MKRDLIDIHCHLLPGIDDGAEDMRETLKSLLTAQQQGVTKIIMTPHFCSERPIAPEQVFSAARDVRSAIQENGLNIEIFTGMECLYSDALPTLLEKGKAMTLAGSRYVLVEFLETSAYLTIDRGLDNILEAGFIPILAHYERYKVLEKPGMRELITNKGALLQMNYDTIQREYGVLKRNPFHKDIQRGHVSFFGSDCHGSTFRKYFLPPSVAWMEKHLSEERVRTLTFDNPMMILQNE